MSTTRKYQNITIENVDTNNISEACEIMMYLLSEEEKELDLTLPPKQCHTTITSETIKFYGAELKEDDLVFMAAIGYKILATLLQNGDILEDGTKQPYIIADFMYPAIEPFGYLEITEFPEGCTLQDIENELLDLLPEDSSYDLNQEDMVWTEINIPLYSIYNENGISIIFDTYVIRASESFVSEVNDLISEGNYEEALFLLQSLEDLTSTVQISYDNEKDEEYEEYSLDYWDDNGWD